MGEQVNVKIIIENVKYDNTIRNVNRRQVNSDTIQLMFRKKSGILDYLNDKFKYTANLLVSLVNKADTLSSTICSI